MVITHWFRTCKLVKFPAVSVLKFESVCVDVWRYGRLISYGPVAVVYLRYSKTHVVCRMWGSQSRDAEGTSVAGCGGVSLGECFPTFDESWCFELDEQAQRYTVRAPNVFGFAVCNLLHVTLWHLESWFCFCTCRKFCVPILKLIVYFTSSLLYVESVKAWETPVCHTDFVTIGHLEYF
jgi:hypothetical protein